MLLALFLHLVLYQLLTARDAPPRKDTEYKINHIDTCPDVGYYFKRETSKNSLEPGACYLCFCQGDSTAVCWKRDNRKCNKESFHYHGVGKRDTRIRRSPGFADLFFRDASRDFFNKNEMSKCKPFESSFSDDCPPADWCTGCTVCDCDANGTWDCHVLSFCPDEKNKKKSKRKGSSSMRKVVGKKPIKPHKTSSSNMSKMTMPNPFNNNKPTNKAKNKATPQIKRERNNKDLPQKRIVKKSVPLRLDMTPEPRKRKTPIRYRRISPRKPESNKEVIIKKNVATHKPIEIKSSKVNLEMEIAKKLMQKVMANLRESVKAEVRDMSKIAIQNNKNIKKSGAKPKAKPNPKKVNKRQIKKNHRKPPQKKPPQKKPPQKKPKKPTKKPIKKPKGKATRKPVSKQYVRYKRDVSIAGDTGIPTIVSQGNSTESINTTVALSIIPVTSNLLVPENGNCSHTPIGSSTLPENEYYKYIVGSEEPKVKVDRPIEDTGTTQVNITETVFNLIGTQFTSTISTQKNTINNTETNKINFTDINPEENDLKFSKWSHLKILKEKKINSPFDTKHKSLVKLIEHSNKTIILEDNKKRVHGKNIERKLNARKYNIVKLLDHPKCKVKNCEINNSSNIQMATKKIGDLQSLLTNILRDFHKTNTTYTPKRKRKFSVLRYLKRIFNKIFKRKKTPDRLSKHQLIETLCENFGPCKVSRKDKLLLNAKLAELDSETTNILKTVKIIKGLLKLVELPKSANSDVSKQENFRNDIQKLNNILKGSYSKNDQAALTATQLTQIEYIKKNTQDFIKSVSKFASLLNEIIAILTKEDMKISKNTNLRNNFINKNLTKDDPFQSLRNLLVRYNLVQNTFMKQMYEQLNNFENKINEKPKVSEVKDLNNSVAIENFSRNIIQNLRKLKRLAQTVSYSGRAKRETARDDDAIEYLLMLMEYLLKQNHQLDVAPVNDGIDLLIEAIRNAPDIKPIKKKVLEYTPATYADSTTTPFSTSIATESTFSEDENHFDNEKSSSEDSGRVKLENTEAKLDENKELVEMVADDEKEAEDKYNYDRRVRPEKNDDVTEMAFYNRLEENIVPEPETVYETTTPMPIEMEISDKLDSQDDINMEKTLTIENNNLDKPSSDSDAGEKKLEMFAGDMDEEIILPVTVTVAETDTPTTMITEFSAQAKKSRTKMRHLNLESYDSESIDKKSKLEWIEENFGKDNEKEFTDFEENNTTLDITTVSPKTIPAQTTDKIDVSNLTKETGDETDKNKKKAKLNAEDVMLRKQMDLLNSLDYGTEKGELYESDSKDANVEDRYSSDTFPSYFV